MSLAFAKKRDLKAPPYCKPPPPPFPPLLPLWPPPLLAAAAHWVDLDPLAPTDMAAYIDMEILPGGGVWFGQTPTTGHRLAITLTQKSPPNYFDVLFQIWDTWRNPENALYSDVKVDPDKPFAIENLGDIHIPGKDFRWMYILA